MDLCRKYRPWCITNVVGNPSHINKALRYLKDIRDGEPKDGKHGLLIIGEVGCGKTTIAKLLAFRRGYVPIVKSAAHLRTKKDFEYLRLVYGGDLRNLFKRSSDNYLKAAKSIESCRLTDRQGVGKCIIIDEFDAVAKGDPGVLTRVRRLLEEERPDHTSMIVTVTDEHYKAIKLLKKRLWEIRLKHPTYEELQSLLDKILKCEQWKMSPEIQDAIIRSSDGNFHTFYNLIELWSRGNRSDNITEFSACLNSNNAKLKRGGLPELMVQILYPDKLMLNDEADKFPTLNRLIETEGNMTTLALHHLYPQLLKSNLKNILQTQATVAEWLSLYDVAKVNIDNYLYTGGGLNAVGGGSNKRASAHNIVNDNDGEESGDPTGFLTIFGGSAVALTLHGKLNAFRTPLLKGYTKTFGVKASREADKRTHKAIRNLSPALGNYRFQELLFLCKRLAAIIEKKDFEALLEQLTILKIDVTDLDTLARLKPINRQNPISKVWKSTVKRQGKKYCIKNKKEPIGIKFADEKPKQKISFFPTS